MCRRLICLVSFVLVPIVADNASADLAAYWKLDDGSGTTPIDASGNERHGEFVGSPQWVDGVFGGALQVSLGNYMVVPGYKGVLGTNPRTCAAWIKTVVGNGVIFGWAPVIAGNKWIVRVNDLGIDGELRCEVHNGYHYGTTKINDDQWHHVAVVLEDDGSPDVAETRLYVDGVLEITGGFEGEPIDTMEDMDVTIGQNPHATNRWFDGLLDELRIYDHALTEAEIPKVMQGGGLMPPALASNPNPADEATDVSRDLVLNWTPGEFVGALSPAHKVLLGENFNDVNDGIGGITQNTDSYTPHQRLDFGKTYYWRVDEANSVSGWDQGNVWSFTVEPVGYPIDANNIAATASSSFDESTGPENTVNGSGLDDNDLHSAEQADIWLTSMTAQPPIWIQYEFDRVYKLHEMWVWNFNQVFEPVVGFGLKDVTIEYSADGTDWAQLAGAPEFARAPGMPGYAHDTTVDFGGAAAKYVKITVNDNWGFLSQYGLSEVRFFYIPVWAREPNPASGSTNVGLDATLGFRAGREAAKHDVYLSTDEHAVIDDTAPVTTVTEASHGPLSLDLGKTYYWRVDEVNDAEIPTAWQGDLWDFTTQEYFVVEDFEAYDDYEPNRVFDTWTDGWGIPTNGATMGYPDPIFVLDEHFVETTIVHSGRQSTPLFYENTAGTTYSEATRTIDAPRDWTQAGIKALTLWFYGDPNNSVTEQMYVKVNGSKVTYDGDADSLTRIGWQMWYIDLAALGVNLSNVTELTIGLERSGAVGGKGVVYFDDIRLSPYDRQLVTPAEPNNAGLLAHWPLDEGSGTTVTDVAGNGYDGTFQGDPQWAAGKFGGALQFDGVDDYVIHTLPEARNYDSFTVALWVRAATLGQGQYMSPFSSHTPNSSGFQIDVDGTNPGVYRTNPGTGNHFGPVTLEWVHLALVGEGTTVHYYYNGTGVTSGILTANDLLFNEFMIGVSRSNENFFDGAIDDFRVYDRVLTPDEIAWLGGRTTPFDKPF